MCVERCLGRRVKLFEGVVVGEGSQIGSYATVRPNAKVRQASAGERATLKQSLVVTRKGPPVQQVGITEP